MATFGIWFYKGTRRGFAGNYNRFAKAFLRGRFTHMEIQYSDGISASSSFTDGGIRFKMIEYDLRKREFVPLPLEWESDSRAWFTKMKGRPYDPWAVLRFVFPFIAQSEYSFECVEAVVASLHFAEGWRLDPIMAHAVFTRIAIEHGLI